MRAPTWITIAAATAISIAASSVCLSATVSAQVAKGHAAYETNCASCHGPAMGGAFGPALKGAEFFEEWNRKTARSLYSRILTTMPASAPGTLSPKTVLAVTVYLLSQNGVSVGSKARTTPDQLSSIVIRH